MELTATFVKGFKEKCALFYLSNILYQHKSKYVIDNPPDTHVPSSNTFKLSEQSIAAGR